MNIDEEKIHEAGKKLAENLPKNLHGKVQFNIADGGYVNADVNLHLQAKQKPQSEKQKGI